MNIQVRVISGEDWVAFRGLRLRALADSPDAFGVTVAEATAGDEAAGVRRVQRAVSLVAWPYDAQMTPDEVGSYAESLPGVKRKGTPARPAWYVHDRLVVRLDDPNTLVIRVPLSKREALLETYPDSFGVPPRMEAHHKVESYLDRAPPDAVHAAIDLAWDMQRHG